MNIDEREKRELLKDITLKKIGYYQKKGDVTDLEVYNTAKEFFKEYFNFNYEFTFDEFKGELDNVFLEESVKTAILSYVTTLSVIEYSDKKFERTELSDLLHQLEVIIHKLIIFEKELRPWDINYWRSKLKEFYHHKGREIIRPNLPQKEVGVELKAHTLATGEKHHPLETKKKKQEPKPLHKKKPQNVSAKASVKHVIKKSKKKKK